ncbi:MAG: triose-phosphate isomerase [Planctomycetota bacterium]|nr:triose-phosphate isomerase [Planctomycetota bacterium]
MSKRKPFVGGNWKMNLHGSEAQALASALNAGFAHAAQVDAAVFPAFPYLASVGAALAAGGHKIKLGAQDGYFQPNGAFTGEVSLSMLKDVGVKVLLTGHSERRHVLHECDELINRKTRAGLDAGLEVILCVGEKLEQREQGQTDAINAGQTALGLAGVKADQMSRVTIAYEPVWAIGTGKNATPADAQAAHVAIRRVLAGLYGDAIAQGVRIQYGGSVKPANAKELFSQPDIDGGLIGGASLKAEDFLGILNAAVK